MNPRLQLSLPSALALIEREGGYADAEQIDRELGPEAVGALLQEAVSSSARVEVLGGFLIRSEKRRGRGSVPRQKES